MVDCYTPAKAKTLFNRIAITQYILHAIAYGGRVRHRVRAFSREEIGGMRSLFSSKKLELGGDRQKLPLAVLGHASCPL